jgi:autotransporter family porin
MSGVAGSTARRRSLLPRLVISGTLLGAVVVAAAVVLTRNADGLASPPGSELPSGAECARTIERSGWEPVPENTEANNHIPDDVDIRERTDYTRPANTEFFPRIDGAFTGTTDEIIEWGACKWGFDPDLVRAQAYAESSWVQSATGDLTDDPEDCVPGDTPPCPTSFGLLQIKHLFHPGTYPSSRESTAFNVDYAMGMFRACYEGWVAYFPDDYRPGDIEGCLGQHFSGRWRDAAGLTYADRVLDIWRTEGWHSLPGATSSLHAGST